MKGILGRKIGMTQVFTKSGRLIPVTVVEVEPNTVTQIKTVENDGYNAIQLGFDTKREKLSTKANVGHTKKANTTPKRFFREIRGIDVSTYTLGEELKANIFTEGEVIDVTGISKGKGFQGVIKRHGQTRGPMTHGSHFHRAPGSMGTRRPMRVFKGKNLPGHMGVETVTIQNLEVVMVDIENNVLLVKGNVPGSKMGLVLIRSAKKANGKINKVEELSIYEMEEAVNQEASDVTSEESSNVENEVIVEENEVASDVEEVVTENTAESDTTSEIKEAE